MIVLAIVIVGFVATLVAAIKLNRAIDASRARLRVLAGGYGDAGLLLSARERFRRRQQHVEQAVDLSTTGVETAHRTIAGLFGSDRSTGAGVYDSVRRFNRGAGRTLSNLFASGPSRRSDSLAEWRGDDPAGDDESPGPRERD